MLTLDLCLCKEIDEIFHRQSDAKCLCLGYEFVGDAVVDVLMEESQFLAHLLEATSRVFGFLFLEVGTTNFVPKSFCLNTRIVIGYPVAIISEVIG